MNRSLARLIPVVVAVPFVLAADLHCAHAQERAPRRVALLVGINEYQKRGFPSLRWAENDVSDLGQELLRMGFDRVVFLKGSNEGEFQATRANITKQLDQLLAGVTKSDIVLVAVCGHGLQLKVKRADGTEQDDNFFCPVNAVLNDPATMLSLSELTDKTLSERGGKNLLFVDACRDALVDTTRGVRHRGIQGRVVSLPEDTAILFSCRAGQQAAERDDLKHGLFTYGVLKALSELQGADRVITWTALVDRVVDRVSELNVEQEPIAAGSMGRLVLSRLSPSRPLSNAGAEYVTNSLGIKFKLIPKGQFWMGSHADDKVAEDDERPQHYVTITRPFYLGVYEVTRGQFRRFVADTGYQTDAEKDGQGGWGYNEQTGKFEGRNPRYSWLFTGFAQTDDHPVVNVSWNDAVAFAAWLSRKEGKEYRLPTEAEWEYACRAGTNSRYSFGDDPEGLAAVGNVADGTAKAKFSDWTTIAAPDGFIFTAPVGRFQPNAWGLFDMHGNVWEWCSDWYGKDYYKESPAVDPAGPSAASARVFRGGSWRNFPRFCRSASRGGLTPVFRNYVLGFRLALVQSPR